ncbi:DUF2125 domain-containing protein [Micromonospora orduensis]|uniref:DUF2125 domain-containing protein n=1 Tax=Micromonospora orduensis TaxID=1420891 RepID=A0A5C4QWS2_9ACTN|nr:DUF2125 domain-containing protein [Micromonospora orduensis]
MRHQPPEAPHPGAAYALPRGACLQGVAERRQIRLAGAEVLIHLVRQRFPLRRERAEPEFAVVQATGSRGAALGGVHTPLRFQDGSVGGQARRQLAPVGPMEPLLPLRR